MGQTGSSKRSKGHDNENSETNGHSRKGGERDREGGGGGGGESMGGEGGECKDGEGCDDEYEDEEAVITAPRTRSGLFACYEPDPYGFVDGSGKREHDIYDI